MGKWASGWAEGPSHLFSQRAARAGWRGSWDLQQVLPPGSPVPAPCLAESLVLPCPYDLSALTPEHLSSLPPNFYLPLLLIHQKVGMVIHSFIKHELSGPSELKHSVIIVIPKPRAQHWRKGGASSVYWGVRPESW